MYCEIEYGVFYSEMRRNTKFVYNQQPIVQYSFLSNLISHEYFYGSRASRRGMLLNTFRSRNGECILSFQIR